MDLIELELSVSFINVDYMVVVINSKSATLKREKELISWGVKITAALGAFGKSPSFPEAATQSHKYFSVLLLSRPAKDDFPNKYRIPF